MQMHENNITEQEALYELPEGWKWCRLGDVCKFENGYAFKSDKFAEHGTPVIRITNIKDNEVSLDDCAYTTETSIDERFLVKKGDLLIAMSGATTGKNGIYWNDDKAYLNQRVGNIKVIDTNVLCDKYRNYYIQSKEQEILLSAYGGAQPNISSNKISAMAFPLPLTLAEQQRIVNRIESMFAKLDEAKEKAQNVVDSFETRKAAILHKAFTGELTANWRKENGISDGSWEEKRLEDVCDFITKGTTPKKEDMSIGNGDIPYIKVYNLCFDTKLDFTIDPTFVKLESHKNFLARSITLPGDVLMNIVGPPFGKVSIVPDSYPEWNINQAIARFRCKPELYNVYLANYLISPKTIENMSRQIKTTAGQQNLTLEICRNMTILVPSLPEQQEIVRILDTVLEKESRAKEAAQTVLEQIALLKKSILARAFRGEV
ncbi:MAG: restriction endonuclease subunit S [Spirochaetales bacterium]|nr:restriction endonuclease subunit S [Spirochaetales bacterium]